MSATVCTGGALLFFMASERKEDFCCPKAGSESARRTVKDRRTRFIGLSSSFVNIFHPSLYVKHLGRALPTFKRVSPAGHERIRCALAEKQKVSQPESGFGFILVGLSVLGVASLQEQISRLQRFLPEVFIAILLLFLGVAIANFLSRAALLAAVNRGYSSARIVSWSIRFVIWILAVTLTLEELGPARQTVISAFSIVFGTTMLEIAIAFGLGGQDLARRFLEKYRGDGKREKDEEPQPL